METIDVRYYPPIIQVTEKFLIPSKDGSREGVSSIGIIED